MVIRTVIKNKIKSEEVPLTLQPDQSEMRAEEMVVEILRLKEQVAALEKRCPQLPNIRERTGISNREEFEEEAKRKLKLLLRLAEEGSQEREELKRENQQLGLKLKAAENRIDAQEQKESMLMEELRQQQEEVKELKEIIKKLWRRWKGSKGETRGRPRWK